MKNKLYQAYNEHLGNPIAEFDTSDIATVAARAIANANPSIIFTLKLESGIIIYYNGAR